MSRARRFGPWHDRAITISQGVKATALYEALTGSGPPNQAKIRATAIQAQQIDLPDIPFEPPPPGRPQIADVGPRSALTTVPALFVESLPAGQPVNNLRIIGRHRPTSSRIYTDCEFIGSETESVILDGKVDSSSVPPYAIDNIGRPGVVPTLRYCRVAQATKLLNVPYGAILENCLLEDAGEDGIYQDQGQEDITVTDTIIRRMGNLRFNHNIGHTAATSHPDLVQVRGLIDGKRIRLVRCDLNGRSANTPGGPFGQYWDEINACLMFQTSSASIARVELEDVWCASGGNYTIRLEDKNFGPVQEWDMLRVTIAQTYKSAGVLNQGGNGTTSGCLMEESGLDLDAIILAGGPWP